QTPPCTQAVIDAGISEVHLAMLDPNPVVTGRGEEELQREGIRTYVGELSEEARQVNEAYIKYITTGKPFITVKFAVSLDGKIATRSGDSEWISSEESRKYVHYLRYTSDAIMAGANTVITDNPRLTCRYAGKGGEARKQPLRVIIDARGRTSSVAQVFNESGKALLVLGENVNQEKKSAYSGVGTELMELPDKNGQLDLETLMKKLGEREITSVLVEGGGILIGSLFDANLVDKVIAFVAPVIIGGEAAKAAVAGMGVDKIKDAMRLERISTERFGSDIMITGYIKK
ncbi:MAG: bifunctional diaminohydroxyphosphoribosylaminopyrimidine deaminase/5-amino-6-(5-phosphoribosylamino)uracil reductase RibD, partial [Dehalococcoidales bacterium]